jgi:hypothetical protein
MRLAAVVADLEVRSRGREALGGEDAPGDGRSPLQDELDFSRA